MRQRWRSEQDVPKNRPRWGAGEGDCGRGRRHTGEVAVVTEFEREGHNSDDAVDRVTARITDDVGSILGTDGREYELQEGDVAKLPAENVGALEEKGAAKRLTNSDHGAGESSRSPHFDGPPEPIVTDDGTTKFAYVAEPQPGGPTDIKTIDLGVLECDRCGHPVECEVSDGGIDKPHECPGCERQGPFIHAGGIDDDTVKAGLRAGDMWYPPSGVSEGEYATLWGNIRAYLRDHWDASEPEVYEGLTAYALSTWVRENLTFVPHLMLMGKTTGGKTRLLNTLARVSYRAMVPASATPSSMFRLIDGYNVSYYISEYHGLGPDAQRQLDNIVRAGQKRGEVVTRSEIVGDGYEPEVFDPFSHVAVATQYTPDDDIVNRCIQIRSSPANREMPPTHDEGRARDIRERLLYARYRLLSPDSCDKCKEWGAAERDAYAYLADRNITGRTREKLLSLLTVAYLCDRVSELEPFVDVVVEQDRDAAADSEDAVTVEVIRECAFDEVGDTTVLGDADPFGAIEIPYSDVVNRFERMTGVEKSPSWLGHVTSRLGLETGRRGDGTVIDDPDLGPKLRQLCKDHNLQFERLDTHSKVRERPEEEQDHGPGGCELCGEDRKRTHELVDGGALICSSCATEERRHD
jgi:hypothetical protein